MELLHRLAADYLQEHRGGASPEALAQVLARTDRCVFVLSSRAHPPEPHHREALASHRFPHEDHLVVVGPTYAVMAMTRDVPLDQRVQYCRLQEEDTPEVLEIALGIWSREPGSPFYLLELALTAARSCL